MESNPLNKTTAAPRKMRFAPKAPAPRVPKAEVENEVVEDTDAVQAKDLLRRFNESSMKARQKVEKKVSASQIAFGYGGASNSIRSFGFPKGTSSHQTSAFNGCRFTPGAQQKEYKEPWDYYSYYPVTLPLRRPYSGNPETLDEIEFREDEVSTYFAETTQTATELDLEEENPEPILLLLQLPRSLPTIKRPAATDGLDASDSSKPPQASEKHCNLNELPAGFMGKMLVYRSGAIKLKLGDNLYEVSSGLSCLFSQDVAAINTAEEHCCVIGELSHRASVIPDLDCVTEKISANKL